MADASPPKWHLAHTTWFFETFVLKQAVPNYKPFHPAYEYLFNSYYEGVGTRHPRHQRGLLSRPLVAEIYEYREHVDDALRTLLTSNPEGEWLRRIELGIHHEQQHQELLITDLKCNLGHNPIRPVYRDTSPMLTHQTNGETSFVTCGDEMNDIGAELSTASFCFDNELPRHSVWLAPYEIADRLVTNLFGYRTDGPKRTRAAGRRLNTGSANRVIGLSIRFMALGQLTSIPLCAMSVITKLTLSRGGRVRDSRPNSNGKLPLNPRMN